MWLSQLTQFAKKLWPDLTTAAIGNINPFPTTSAPAQRSTRKVVAVPVLTGFPTPMPERPSGYAATG